LKKFPHYTQLDVMDCGPTCLRMIAKHYGKSFTLQTLRDRSGITREGVSLLGMSDAAESIGMRSMGVKITFKQLEEQAPLPAIVHWGQMHFVIVYKIQKKKKLFNKKPETYVIHVADPASGLIKYTKEEFEKKWISTQKNGENQGIALLLEPTPDIFTQKDSDSNKAGFNFLFSYLKPHRKFVLQLVLSFVAGSLLQLVFPFLTQSVVDFGIANQNINFIYLVLIAQLVLYASRTGIEFIRSWILLHISTRINISLISDFLIKLMKLPISFFDAKMTGDIMQRIGDHRRIETFLTNTSVSIVFAVFNLVIFGAVLAWYNLTIFTVFITGSVLYAGWILFFMKKRRTLDHKNFALMSGNQSNVIQLIQGMQEIKLHNSEKQKRWEWERIQAQLFQVRISRLSLDQYQQAGSLFINESKNILISFLAAVAVVNSEMTLGMMLAVQYIIGQLNSPITQMVTFVHSAQDAKISLERLNEIHVKEDEEDSEMNKVHELPENKDIHFTNVHFSYTGGQQDKVLHEINLTIPDKKITAIVGTSGSGKTTIIKLLLGFYPPSTGEIKISGTHISDFSVKMWRSKCGTVMQDGFIFSDSIAKNIAVGDENVDKEKLLNAVNVANIREYIESLPLAYNTKIGQDGVGLSQGQKQRLLIARAVYKKPEFILFDEATSALDANNEKVIMENLNQFFKGKTAIVVAHRLSTVKNADKIVVLEKGRITEEGSHEELIKKRGYYYELIKNQLELGD